MGFAGAAIQLLINNNKYLPVQFAFEKLDELEDLLNRHVHEELKGKTTEILRLNYAKIVLYVYRDISPEDSRPAEQRKESHSQLTTK